MDKCELRGCGNKFKRTTTWQKYCTSICRQLAHYERVLKEKRKPK